MTTYRDRLTEDYDREIGRVVGCALDRVGRAFTHHEIQHAVDYFNAHRQQLDQLPLAARRDSIASLFET
jgi:hypothetical protein